MVASTLSRRCWAEVTFRAVIFRRLKKASEILAGVDIIERVFQLDMISKNGKKPKEVVIL